MTFSVKEPRNYVYAIQSGAAGLQYWLALCDDQALASYDVTANVTVILCPISKYIFQISYSPPKK